MVVDDARGVAVRLPAGPGSTAGARHVVRSALTDWGLHRLVDVVQLLASEVVTNAVLHARTDVELRVELLRTAVRVTVCDASPRPVVRRRYGLDAGTGRGLGLVDTLAAAWGTGEVAGWSKAVWFEVDLAGAPDAAEGALYGEDWGALVDDL